jgi:hypothetical protein
MLMHAPSAAVQAGKALDLPVYFGDAGSSAVLHSLGAQHAACAVITLDTPGAAPFKPWLFKTKVESRKQARKWICAACWAAWHCPPLHLLTLLIYHGAQAPTTAACGPCTSTSRT